MWKRRIVVFSIFMLSITTVRCLKLAPKAMFRFHRWHLKTTLRQSAIKTSSRMQTLAYRPFLINAADSSISVTCWTDTEIEDAGHRLSSMLDIGDVLMLQGLLSMWDLLHKVII